MKNYVYLVQHDARGNHLVVTRVLDGAMKYFFLAGADNTAGLSKFMNSMTDELVDGYFPRAGKKSQDSVVDNWAFLGANPGRQVAEHQARIDLTAYRLAHSTQT